MEGIVVGNCANVESLPGLSQRLRIWVSTFYKARHFELSLWIAIILKSRPLYL